MGAKQFLFIRFVALPCFALFFSSAGYLIIFTDEYGRQFLPDKPIKIYLDIGVSAIFTVFCSEISLKIFTKLQQWFPIETRPKVLIFTQICLSTFLWIETFTITQILIYGYDSKEQILMLKQNILIALIVAIGMNSIHIGMALFLRWKAGMEEAENLKRANIEAQNTALKQQIDPHFLFNSLNTLTALIEEEHHHATQFVKELSNVYRYVLQSKDQTIVSLEEEISFAKAYSYLFELRFCENIHFDYSISDIAATRGIPPLVVQLCIENAVKHNIISRHKPLLITITDDENGMLVISNTLQRKRNVPVSTKIGLSTIRHRYSLISPIPVQIVETENQFIVRLPLFFAPEPAMVFKGFPVG